MQITKVTTFGLLSVIAVLATADCANAEVYSPISDARSGNEPSLYEVMNYVAPDGNWQSTAQLNAGADGRRLSDDLDMVWQGHSIEVSLLTYYWGGQDEPCDSLGQRLVYDDVNLDGARGTRELLKDGPSSVATIQVSNPDGLVIFGDQSSKSTAWTVDLLNSAFSNGERDRVVTFDVSGLDIYRYNGQGYELYLRDVPQDTYVMAFDPGQDQDYQDMVVLFRGITRIPEPATLALLFVGGLMTLRKTSAKTR